MKNRKLKLHRNNYQMRMIYMQKDDPCTIIDIDFKNEKIKIKNLTDDNLDRAFGVNLNPTWEDFEFFLEDRCFPRSRGYLKWFLKGAGVDSYDPLRIVEHSQGRCAEDDMWIDIKYLKGGKNVYRIKRQ